MKRATKRSRNPRPAKFAPVNFEPQRFTCRGCGGGPSLCVCDPQWEKLERNVRAFARRGTGR